MPSTAERGGSRCAAAVRGAGIQEDASPQQDYVVDCRLDEGKQVPATNLCSGIGIWRTAHVDCTRWLVHSALGRKAGRGIGQLAAAPAGEMKVERCRSGLMQWRRPPLRMLAAQPISPCIGGLLPPTRPAARPSTQHTCLTQSTTICEGKGSLSISTSLNAELMACKAVLKPSSHG